MSSLFCTHVSCFIFWTVSLYACLLFIDLCKTGKLYYPNKNRIWSVMRPFLTPCDNIYQILIPAHWIVHINHDIRIKKRETWKIKIVVHEEWFNRFLSVITWKVHLSGPHCKFNQVLVHSIGTCAPEISYWRVLL